VRDGWLVGAIAMDPPVRHGGAEIGYWVRSDAWGNGYATEAVRTLARFAFEHGVHRVLILADVGNVASARVALRAGFSYEGIARLGSQSQRGLADHAVFARLATDSDGQLPASWPELTQLTDGVLLLRQPRPEDWPTLYAEGSNAESRRWGFGGEYTEQ